jgi:flagella basal body P-ring formation protein FlgA
MIRIVLTLTFLSVLGRDAGAESAAPAGVPRLQELVAVTSEIVRIGDLVKSAGDAADVPVFRAPDLGGTGTVPVARVVEALRPHGLDRLDTGGLNEVVVTRLSRAITGDELKDRIARAFAGQFGFGPAQNLSVVLDRQISALHVEAAATAELAITRINVEPRTGRFDVAFELPGSGVARRMSLRFSGTVVELVPATTLARSLKLGDIIKASDVVMERRPKLEVGGEVITASEAVGLAAKHALRSGQVLRAADLVKAQIVQRNEAVTLVYEVPGVVLTVRGKALEAGALGDIVGVINVQSNRTIQGTVTGPGRITVAAAGPFAATSLNAAGNDPTRPQTQ